MPPPQAILCDLCGQKFFKRSLPIHRKQCEKKYQAAFTECKKCLRKVSNDEYEKHFSECKVVRTQRVAKPRVQKERAIKPAADVAKKSPNEDGESDSESESSSDEEDYREECGFCQRKFNPDRIAKHEQICATNSERKRRKQFKSASQSRLEGTEFEQYIDPSTRRQVDDAPSRWRNDHERLKGIVEQGRLVKVFQESGIPLSELPSNGADLQGMLETGTAQRGYDKPEDAPVPEGMKRCQHCMRSFKLETAEKHIPKCKTTVNKPKMLVRKSKPVLEKPKQDNTELIKEAIRRVLKMKNKKDDFYETKEASMFRDGETAYMEDGRRGIVRYVGRVGELYPGYWVGLELPEGKGHNDGSIENHRYFKCESEHGVFVRPSKLTKNPPLAKVHEAEGISVEKKPSKAHVSGESQSETQSKSTKQKAKQEKAPATPETDEEVQPKNSDGKSKQATVKNVAGAKKGQVNKAAKPEKTDAAIEKDRSSKADSGQKHLANAAKPKPGMVERLREEVRKNSPRAPPGPNQGDEKAKQTAPKQRKQAQNNGNSKAVAAEIARQKRLEKDVKFLEALHGKMAQGERGIGSREEVGTGQRLGAASEPKQAARATKGKPTAAPAAGAGGGPRADREARAAYFEKMFAQQKNQQQDQATA